MRTAPPATGLPRVVYVLMLGLLYPVVSRVPPRLPALLLLA